METTNQIPNDLVKFPKSPLRLPENIPDAEYSDPDSSFSPDSSFLENQQVSQAHGFVEYQNLVFSNITNRMKDLFPNKLHIPFEHRAIAINWMLQLFPLFNYNEETKYASIALFDQIISTKPIPTNQIQLYVAVCVWIESKINEVSIPSLSDLIFICAHAYTENEFKECEIDILNTLSFDVAMDITPLILLQSFLIELGFLSTSLNPIPRIAFFFLENAIFLPHFSSMDPITIALASIYLSYFSSNCPGSLYVDQKIMSHERIYKYALNISDIAHQTLKSCQGSIYEEISQYFNSVNVPFELFQSNFSYPLTKEGVTSFFKTK